MSAWLRLVNDLKRTAAEEHLTSQQRAVWQSLCALLAYPQRINLHGPSGSGKTYVAWMLARATGAVHLPSPSLLDTVEPATETILIDNAPTDAITVRSLWARCNLLDVHSVVIITQVPVSIPTRTLVLDPPNEQDWHGVHRTLMRLGYLPPSPTQPFSSFWEYLRQCV